MEVIQNQDADFSYKATIIIPIYNSEKYLEECLKSLLVQTMPQNEMEVLLINDGSTDSSVQICEQFTSKYDNFKLISQENRGVSAARNNGIKRAKGEYIFFLDSDDTYSAGTIRNVTRFFDEHKDETDIVTFPLVFVGDNGNKWQHYRYKILKQNGIYDINEKMFVSLTTINVAIKNKGRNTVLFDEDLHYHEDEHFLTQIVVNCGNFGFIRQAVYFYRKHNLSVTGSMAHPYYYFEDELGFNEELYKRYIDETGRPIKYVQNILLNDWGWRIRNDTIFPYHYEKNDFDIAMSRFVDLLNKTDDCLILTHPNIDIYHRFFLLSLKDKRGLGCLSGKNMLALYRNDKILYYVNYITIIFTKTKTSDFTIELHGFIKSPLFNFSFVPDLFVEVQFGEEEKNVYKLSLSDCTHDYYKSKIKTNRFFRFEFKITYNNLSKIRFFAKICDEDIKLKYYFIPNAVFRNGASKQTFFRHGNRISFFNDTLIVEHKDKKEYNKLVKNKNKINYWKKNKKFWLVRALANYNLKKNRKIWLYVDSANVGKDNGYYQFLHDYKINDGVERFFVVHNIEFIDIAKEDGIDKKHLIMFGSKLHKMLYLNAEKVITGYIEQYNYLPFDMKTYSNYRDINEPEIIYLQHGVLHAHMPWKYSFERLGADKEVVSTHYELDNLTKNYNFRPENIIQAGMPRYDFVDIKTNKSENHKKILYAPSWRRYLIDQDSMGNWFACEKLFKESSFYLSVQAFLNSSELCSILNEYGYILELKLHPIFRCYEDMFSTNNSCIRMADKNIKPDDYSIFISDFSSFQFDFVYQKIAIMYFFPDYDMFKAGLNAYRELDLPLEDGFGPFAQTADEAILELKHILEQNGKTDNVYQERMNDFFLHYDNNQCDRIYQALIDEDKMDNNFREEFIDLLK